MMKSHDFGPTTKSRVHSRLKSLVYGLHWRLGDAKFSRLNDHCKRKKTPEYGYLNSSGLLSLIFDRTKGPAAKLYLSF
jgi:hypothetical protein